MVRSGFVGFAIRQDLMARVDEFVGRNRDGYGSRAEVISAAIRAFLKENEQPHQSPRPEQKEKP